MQYWVVKKKKTTGNKPAKDVFSKENQRLNRCRTKQREKEKEWKKKEREKNGGREMVVERRKKVKEDKK